MNDLIEVKPPTITHDKAWEYDGQTYTARSYEWKDNYQKNWIGFYKWPSGQRVLDVETKSWTKAIGEFKKLLKS